MDAAILFQIALNSFFLATLLVGAYLIFKQLPGGRVKNILLFIFLYWITSIIIYASLQVTRAESGIGTASPLDPTALMIGIGSQPILLLLFYNLILSFKRSMQVVAVHYAIIFALIGVVYIIEANSSGSFFDTYHSIQEAYANIGSPFVTLKLTIVAVQMIFSISMMVVAHRLVPIYQRHIEQNESNTAYNILWTREISAITFLITILYTINILFVNYTTCTIYYVVVTPAFIRMINVLLQHKHLENYDGLYRELEIKWSFKRLWYVDEAKINNKERVHKYFNQILEWIDRERPYTNPDFSYRDLTKQFNELNYNEFDTLLRNEHGHSFQSYIRERRIHDAIVLMETSKEIILLKEIAYHVGFENSSAFSRAFKAVKGVPATEWRRAETRQN